jgi:TRAP-type C4-dicarboxylate transport system permease small subunit
MWVNILAFIRAAVRSGSLTLLALLVITPLAQIGMRGIFNVPMSSAEELARYFMICLTFFASSYVTIEGGQIRMEEFQGLLPPLLRWYLQMLIEISGVVMFSVICVASAITIGNNMQNQTPTLEMPFWLFMGPLLVGSLLLVLETTLSFFHTLRRRGPEKKNTVLT